MFIFYTPREAAAIVTHFRSAGGKHLIRPWVVFMDRMNFFIIISVRSNETSSADDVYRSLGSNIYAE